MYADPDPQNFDECGSSPDPSKKITKLILNHLHSTVEKNIFFFQILVDISFFLVQS